MAGGNTKPTDSGDNWVIKYMDCVGRVDEKADWILVNKKTGEIQTTKAENK